MSEWMPFLFSGMLGYLLGQSQYSRYESLINNIQKRVEQLSNFKVTPPIRMFKECKVKETFYKEAVQAYILGMPNSSVIMSIKNLELGLKCKFSEKKVPLRELIDNLEGDYKDIAHGFRIIRNFVMHEIKEVDEPDALNALRYTSIILVRLFPFKRVNYKVFCESCKYTYEVPLKINNFYLGNTIKTKCPKCGNINVIRIGEKWVF